MSRQAFAERAQETEQAREKLANGTSLLRGEPKSQKIALTVLGQRIRELV
jgi:hypothetical protein